MDSSEGVQPISSLRAGNAKLKGTITQLRSHRIRNGNLMTEAVITDETGTVRCVWFSKSPKLDLKLGSEYIITGKYELKYGHFALQVPKYRATGVYAPTETFAQPAISLSKPVAHPYIPKKKSFDWSAVGAVVFWAVIIIGGIILFSHSSASNNGASAAQPSISNSTPSDNSTTSTQATDDSTASDNDTGSEVTQSYWYCWDTGNPSPHHLGYYVSGDHYCTNQELHNAGYTGY